ncbi:MAG: HupE/UreJ family protein [Bacteroidetes bacterium]|nr:MAG: HupE/UreJ family protein [Bacteroidota bacterium]
MSIYFSLGLDHILDPNGYDHILFVVALCAVYRLRQWRDVLVLVTAFTIGHSFTLALASLRLLDLPSALVEFLIPLTILLTCIYNIFRGTGPRDSRLMRINYLLALGFGFIHGMGFSGYFRELLGREAAIAGPLFFFNLGIEAGQICIVGTALLLSWLLLDIARLPHKYWNIAVSAGVGLVALRLLFERMSGF